MLHTPTSHSEFVTLTGSFSLLISRTINGINCYAEYVISGTRPKRPSESVIVQPGQ